MGQVEVTYTKKEELLEHTKYLTDKVLQLFQMMRAEIESDWGKYEQVLENFNLRDYGVSPVLGNTLLHYGTNGPIL